MKYVMRLKDSAESVLEKIGTADDIVFLAARRDKRLLPEAERLLENVKSMREEIESISGKSIRDNVKTLESSLAAMERLMSEEKPDIVGLASLGTAFLSAFNSVVKKVSATVVYR